MYARFGLTLTVTHACNLRCSYCYAGEKFHRTMSERVGRKAIDRALASLLPGGTLELGFFGGEPLLEARLVGRLIDHTRARSRSERKSAVLNVTTNGTVVKDAAWSIMSDPEVALAISCDGRPDVHDRHRIRCDGAGSSGRVVSTIRRLVADGKPFSVIMVVRPDTVHVLPESMTFLFDLGVSRLEPSLDIWATWTARDIARLEHAVERCADVWRDGLPDCGIGWFDEKAAELAELPAPPTARCGFGRGEIAVAPSGRLYPCERLIGADAADNPMALPVGIDEGADFLFETVTAERSGEACDACAMRSSCNTLCRCSNYVRTGRVDRPDRLLCAWNQACLTQTARVLNELTPHAASSSTSLPIRLGLYPQEQQDGFAGMSEIA